MLTPEIIASQEYQDAVAIAVSEATSPLQTSVSNLESTNAAFKTEKQQLATKISDLEGKYAGIDVEAMQARLAEVDNDETRALLAQGQFDKVYEKQFAQKDADHLAQLEAANKKADEQAGLAGVLQSTLVATVRDGGISQAFVSTEADSSLLVAAQAIAQMTINVDGKPVPVIEVGNDGQSIFRDRTTGQVLAKAEGQFGYSDWLTHLAEKDGLRLFAKPNGHSDPNAITSANPKGMVRSKMTDEQVDAFQKEHGTEAFLNLPLN